MIRKVNYVLLFSTLLLLLVSCGTDSPSGGDDTNPEVKLLMVYNDADTLYNSLDPSAFTPFGKSILPGDHKIKFKASDNESLYKLTLFAEDTITGVKYEIKSISSPTSNDTLITFTYDMFPVVQDDDMQKFYLTIKVQDESENVSQTEKLGFKVIKQLPFNVFYNSLGLLKEVESDSAEVDFRLKNNKLAFIQFMSKGCLSCVDEANEMKAMYKDAVYDTLKYSHSVFGSDSFTEAELKSLKVRDMAWPFDCFWDGTGSIKDFFEELLGKNIENEVFAVLPSGKIIEYDYSVSFTEWIHLMYNTAY